MSLVTIDEIDSYGKQRYSKKWMTKSSASILEEEVSRVPFSFEFDIFLSHSYTDAKLDLKRLLGLKAFLEAFNLTVYVDWLIDTNLNRTRVTKETAETLRKRMTNSKGLLFATSENSQNSRWMPWELGYMDGKGKRVAVFPLAERANQSIFEGQEYLGIYPYVDKDRIGKTNINALWVNEDPITYVKIGDWLDGKAPYTRN